MKTKFIGIPKQNRTAMRKRARGSLLHWKAMHVVDKTKIFLGEESFVYPLNQTKSEYLKFSITGDRIHFWYKEREKVIIFDITKEQWAIDLFNQLYNVKAIGAK